MDYFSDAFLRFLFVMQIGIVFSAILLVFHCRIKKFRHISDVTRIAIMSMFSVLFITLICNYFYVNCKILVAIDSVSIVACCAIYIKVFKLNFIEYFDILSPSYASISTFLILAVNLFLHSFSINQVILYICLFAAMLFITFKINRKGVNTIFMILAYSISYFLTVF